MPPFRGVFPKKGAKKQGPLSLAEKRPLCVLILLLPDHPQPSQKQDTVQCSLAVEVSALAASNLIQLPDIIQHQFAVLFIQLCVLSDLVADVGESSLPASFRQLLIQLLQSGFDEAVYGILQDLFSLIHWKHLLFAPQHYHTLYGIAIPKSNKNTAFTLSGLSSAIHPNHCTRNGVPLHSMQHSRGRWRSDHAFGYTIRHSSFRQSIWPESCLGQ